MTAFSFLHSGPPLPPDKNKDSIFLALNLFDRKPENIESAQVCTEI